jgi:hypothetical protein
MAKIIFVVGCIWINIAKNMSKQACKRGRTHNKSVLGWRREIKKREKYGNQ